MPEQDEDPVALAEGAPKRMFEFFAELYKALRDRKQQELMAKQQQDNQAALQKQQQDFMADQNERLMDTMKQAGIDSDANKQAGKTGLNRLERLAEDEVQTQAKLDDIDKQIKAVDDEQRSLLSPTPDLGKVDERLNELDRQQAGANEMHRATKNDIMRRTGITDEVRNASLAELNKKKEAADKAIAEERAGLEKIKADHKTLTPEEITNQLKDLDQAQIDADQLHKSKMQGLMETPGMEPDKLFEGMEKLKAEKAEVDKGISQKRDGLKGKENPLTAGQKADKLGELHEKKAGLLKEKGGLQEKLKGIDSEKTGIMQGKGMNLQTPKQGMGQGLGKGPQVGKGNGMGVGDALSDPGQGQGQLMCGGFDVGKKALSKPNSVAATIAKELQSAGKYVKEGLSTAIKAGKHALK